MTEAERRIWIQIKTWRQHFGCHIRRQAPIGPYFADFVCHKKKIVIEIDGGQHTPEADAVRTRFLQSRGYRVIRFWNTDVLNNTEGVLQTIATELKIDWS